jgi:hypothetical protein
VTGKKYTYTEASFAKQCVLLPNYPKRQPLLVVIGSCGELTTLSSSLQRRSNDDIFVVFLQEPATTATQNAGNVAGTKDIGKQISLPTLKSFFPRKPQNPSDPHTVL